VVGHLGASDGLEVGELPRGRAQDPAARGECAEEGEDAEERGGVE